MMIKDYDELVLEHYRNVAKSQGDTAKSTMEDLYVREAEISFLARSIEDLFEEDQEIKILDLGCGNGYVLSRLREKFPKAQLFGVEYTPELFEIAKKRQIPNTQIIHGDAREGNWFNEQFDLIYTERVLINIRERKDQYLAVENIKASLKRDGHYLLMESFKEPLDELNRARREMCLTPIFESYQNKYINERFIRNINVNYGFVERPGIMPQNYLSTHFFITRILHKSARPTGGKVKGSRFAKFFLEALPSAIGNYSPILFRRFQRSD